MGNLIRRKKDKIDAILSEYGIDITEESFIRLFIERYPVEWQRIQEQYQNEEKDTPPGKKHPMPHPNVYMKEMYRNAMRRRQR